MKIEAEHAERFITDTLRELGGLDFSLVSEAAPLIPKMAVLMRPENVKERDGRYAWVKGGNVVEWLMAQNSFKIDWGQILRGTPAEVVSYLRTERLKCFIGLLEFMEAQFTHQIFTLGEPENKNPEEYWFVKMRGEFLRETVALGSPGCRIDACAFLDAGYAFVRKEGA